MLLEAKYERNMYNIHNDLIRLDNWNLNDEIEGANYYLNSVNGKYYGLLTAPVFYNDNKWDFRVQPVNNPDSNDAGWTHCKFCVRFDNYEECIKYIKDFDIEKEEL